MDIPILPADVARCKGLKATYCVDCLRRTSPPANPERTFYMTGIWAVEICPYRIDPPKPPKKPRKSKQKSEEVLETV